MVKPCFIACNYPRKEIFWITSGSLQSSSSRQVSTLVAFISAVNIRGTHRDETLDMPSFVCMMVSTLPVLIPRECEISRTLTRRFSITHFSTAEHMSSVVTSTGRPERGSSSKDCLPRRNSADHFLTVVYEGEEFPYTLTMRS